MATIYCLGRVCSGVKNDTHYLCIVHGCNGLPGLSPGVSLESEVMKVHHHDSSVEKGSL